MKHNKATGSTGVSVKDSNDIDFGKESFSFSSYVDIPLKIYVQKHFYCAVCGHEGDYTMNLEGKPEIEYVCPILCTEMS